jgi:hypothetical protein
MKTIIGILAFIGATVTGKCIYDFCAGFKEGWCEEWNRVKTAFSK